MAKDVMCKNCLFLSNGWCEKKADSPVPDMVRDCRHFQQKTNADRIRAMSDEELAAFLNRKREPCNYCQLAVVEGACTETLCDDAMMNWLKEPVEEAKSDD